MSGSEPVRVTAWAVLKATFTDCGLAVGTPAATVSVTVAAGLVLNPLLTVKVKLSGPW